MDKVVIITGPTAVGKTKCSLLIAERLNTQIINGDAYQIYKGMDIGTAKPSKEELSKIKHHLMDYLDPLDNFSVADYQKLVRNKIDEFKSKNIIPLIVGGSGLYLESVICNYTFDGKTRDHSFEEKYRDLSNEELHLLLKDLDIISYNEIHPNNRKRVLRALELALSNEQKGTKKKEMLYDALVIVLNDDREALYNRINNRVDQMLDEGLLEEVKSFYPDKLGLTAKAAICSDDAVEGFTCEYAGQFLLITGSAPVSAETEIAPTPVADKTADINNAVYFLKFIFYTS
jgi:tRNA dimethylallyltransferase